MPALSAYSGKLDYSYAPGFYPAAECLLHRPEAARRLLLHSSAQGREGAERLCALARERGLRVETADRALSRLSGKENCYAAVVFSKFQDALDPALPHVALHEPGDSGNVGTILRTALGFGVEDVALFRPCVDVFDPKCVRASMGSLFSLRVRVYDDFEAYRAEFPNRRLFPFMLDGAVSLTEALRGEQASREPWTLVFGNEGRGLPPSFAALGQAVRIESGDRVDSLNLAVAAGIGIYAFTRPLSGRS